MLRVVFDTNVVVSALRFQASHLAWLRAHWAARVVQVLGSRATVDELIAVLAYPKFELTPADIAALLGDFLPVVEVVEASHVRNAPRCREAADQKFIDLAICGRADVVVTGDKDLLGLRPDASFAIEAPADYAKRFARPDRVREPRAGYRRVEHPPGVRA